MRYHFEKPTIYRETFGKLYICDHPLYRRCTLYLIGQKGLAVVQQRFNPNTKSTNWSEIDRNLIDEIYIQPKFKQYFDQYASEPVNKLYPTVTVRQIMYGLRMKPLPRQPWETYFDRKPL